MNGTRKRIVLAGGSGFIGSALAKELLARNYEVVVLTRTPRERNDGIVEFAWSGEHIGEWIKFLDGAEAVVNLTGKNINCPHTPENLRELAASRVNSVRAIALALDHVKNPPRVWIQSGAIGFYGDQGDKICDEDSPAGNDALAKICQPWEAGFNSASAPKTRKVLLRIGFRPWTRRWRAAGFGKIDEMVSRRSRRQRQAIHQLDSHFRFGADVRRRD